MGVHLPAATGWPVQTQILTTRPALLFKLMTTNDERAARDKCLVRFLATPVHSTGVPGLLVQLERERERRRARRRHRIGMALEITAGGICVFFVLWCAWGLMIAFSR